MIYNVLSDICIYILSNNNDLQCLYVNSSMEASWNGKQSPFGLWTNLWLCTSTVWCVTICDRAASISTVCSFTVLNACL